MADDILLLMSELSANMLGLRGWGTHPRQAQALAFDLGLACVCKAGPGEGTGA